MSGEAQRVLRTFSTVSLEKEDQKPMPSFPDMVAYVQEKVRLGVVVHSCRELCLKGFIFGIVLLLFQAAQRIKTPAKYIVGTSTIPFNPSAFGEVNTI